MADFIADSNIFVRLANKNDVFNSVAEKAVKTLGLNGDRIFILPQNLHEFYVVATRPASARGGLGLTPAQAKIEMNRLREIFNFLPDTAEVFTVWTRIVDAYGVSGVAAHDARIVAAMQVHGISNLLTFNTADFVRYSNIVVLHPSAV